MTVLIAANCSRSSYSQTHDRRLQAVEIEGCGSNVEPHNQLILMVKAKMTQALS